MRQPDSLLTLAEAAERLDVHYMTAYRYVRTGRLAATKEGQEWRVEDAEILRFGREREVRGAAVGSAEPNGDRRRTVDHAARLEARLVESDEAGAWSLVESALASGMDPEDVLLEVVAPAMAAVGEAWFHGRLSVAEEHQATAMASRLVSRLGPRFSRRGRTRGHVVVGSVPGDSHALPSAILRDLLRGRGLTVTDLGGDPPIESWVEVASAAAERSPRLVALGMCATSAGNDAAIEQVVAAVRSVTSAPIVLGGHATQSAARAMALGADEHTTSFRDAVDRIDAIASSPH